MLHWLAQFAPELSVFNVRYITFRTGGALITALLFVFLFGPSDPLLAHSPGQGPAHPQRRP